MSDRIIPIIDLRALNTASAPLAPSSNDSDGTKANGVLSDTLHRPLHDLRISVTDRCNFRCVYCMPRQIFNKNYAFLPHPSLLTFEEITRAAKLFAAHGVHKIRLTGGEPLLRKDLHKLVGMLSNIRTPAGTPLDLTLTTNGALLAKKAQLLKDAGLNRVTVSLDALDDGIFKRMNDANFSASDILHGLDAAHKAGLEPIKINMVVKAGMNDQQIIPMARHFKGSPFILRFIEYMDVGNSNGWNLNEVMPSRDVIKLISGSAPDMQLIPADSNTDIANIINNNINEATAQRWKYRDGSGEIGVISSVTQTFCHTCSRLRLSTEGKLYTCLFASAGHDMRQWLRNGTADEQISDMIAQLWHQRSDRYSELRSSQTTRPDKIEMSYIGG